MRIMVFDVPAIVGGALSILEGFHKEVNNYNDKSVQWIFVISEPFLEETDNIKVLRFPWIKKSWLHRLFFDQYMAPKLVREYQPDKIFSLQNIIIPKVSTEQITYIHQPLPFIEYRFSFKENKLFWFYQNILSKTIYKSIKKSQKVIVQTNWFKVACIQKTGISGEKVIVVPPKINVDIENYFEESEKSLSTFFYPAGASYYKNHRLIVQACELLKQQYLKKFRVIFTLDGNENNHIADLYKKVQEKKLPINFIGNISRNKVFDYYSKSVLLFPSYIETFGLPMLESKLTKGIIIAADTAFSHEILDVYQNAHFFDKFSSEELAGLMRGILNGSLSYFSENSINLINQEEELTLVNQIVQSK